jgi:hypothetical protein
MGCARTRSGGGIAAGNWSTHDLGGKIPRSYESFVTVQISPECKRHRFRLADSICLAGARSARCALCASRHCNPQTKSNLGQHYINLVRGFNLFGFHIDFELLKACASTTDQSGFQARKHPVPQRIAGKQVSFEQRDELIGFVTFLPGRHTAQSQRLTATLNPINM